MKIKRKTKNLETVHAQAERTLDQYQVMLTKRFHRTQDKMDFIWLCLLDDTRSSLNRIKQVK